MEDNNSKSEFSVEVGQFDCESDDIVKMKLCLDFNKDKADET
jgi:hypothetical protein